MMCFSFLSYSNGSVLIQTGFGHQSKKKTTITRVKRGNVLTLLHKQEMDFQDLSLSYTRGTDQINGVKRKRTIFFFFFLIFCVNQLDPE